MDFNILKTAIENGDSDRAADFLVDLYMTNPDNFKKSLLLSNSLPEPLERGFSEKKEKTLVHSFLLAGTKLIEKDVDVSKYKKQFRQLSQAIHIIHKNSQSNVKRLEKSNFFDFTLSEQLQMMCIFIEDQHRLSNELLRKNKSSSKSKYITGMENEVAKYNVEHLNDVKVSLTDNFEALVDIADTLFRLLYFRSRNSIEKTDNFNHENISPYNIGSLEEIIHLTLQRNLSVDLWGKFKFREWKLKIQTVDNENYFIFEPPSFEDYKKERIAINRYIYRDHINVQQEQAKNLNGNQKLAKSIDEVAGIIDVDNLNTLFHLPKKQYLKPNKLIQNILRGQIKSLDEVYVNLEHDGIKIQELLKAFEYLFTIAQIYQHAVLNDFNQENTNEYKKLAPIVDKRNLINQFKGIYGLENGVAEKIINILTFSNKPLIDIYSQPLIYVGKDKVVFCPSLILQMNIVRIIELLTNAWDLNISYKGRDFEKDLRFILSFNPHIKVNTNKIEFVAYDGRDIEFDFIGLFEDHLLLIEFKHIRIPFNDKMKRTTLETLDFGIEQVNRRSKVIKEDWDKIKERCSFKLPDIPPDENRIIKLVCTNIFDFSTIIRNDVEIIDSSSLLKFFMAPEVKGISVGSKVEEVFNKNLWDKNYPSVKEFKQFLQCPIAIQPFVDCYEGGYKPIEMTEEGDYRINFFDYSLVKDPYGQFNQELSEAKHIKVGRNEPCPCQSGKKYKKCCGN